MSWFTSDRGSRLPSNWRALRSRVIERDGGVCQWFDNGAVCGLPGSDVDHIVPGDDHSLVNLRLLCGEHHARKSSWEGYVARVSLPSRYRPREDHPGFL